MAAFRYQAIGENGASATGVVEADDRRMAVRELTDRGLFPSRLEPVSGREAARAPAPTADATPQTAEARPGRRISRKEVTALTDEMATLLEATIPIPKALESLGDQEQNPSLKYVIEDLASLVRRGTSLSAAMERYPKLFPVLYTSMIKVGEESGHLDKVMTDLSELMQNEDEMRSEVLGAVAYPAFVLFLGAVTTFILLAFVMPSLFTMLKGIFELLPLPTRILLAVSGFVSANWLWILLGTVAAAVGSRYYMKTPDGALAVDRWKLKLPLLGGVFRASALGRFARTLGTLEVSGVSLLPALEIVKNTVGNRQVSRMIERVSDETRGGDSLAAPLRKLGLFPPTMVQMISVGEETGRLGQMLLRVAEIQERVVRGRSKTLISLLAPVLILVVGAVIGFIVISLLLPIFKMSQGMQ